ncbi:MAG: MFS transporter [Vallitalea sp.]|jgi:MFS family permease|nr:MFS transporter [Vallitalea sp.]
MRSYKKRIFQQKNIFLLCIAIRNIFEAIVAPGGLIFTSFFIFLGLADHEIGYILGFIALTNVFQLFSPVIYEKFKSPKKMVLILRILRFCSFYFVLLLPFVENLRFVILLFIIFTSMSFGSLMGGIFLAWNDRIIPMDRKGRYYSTRNLIANGIAILIPLCIGKILDHYTHTTKLFIIIFIVSIFFAIGELLIITKLDDYDIITNNKISLKKILFLPLRDKKYRDFIIFSLLWMFAFSFARPFFNLYAIRYIKLSYKFIAFVASTTAIIKLLLAKVWGAGVDRFGWKKILKYTGLFYASTHFLWFFIHVNSHIIYFLFVLINGIFMIGFNISKFNVNLALTDHENRLSYIAVNSAITALFSFISTNISTSIIQLINPQWKLFSFDIFQVLFGFAGLLYLVAIVYIIKKDL